MKIIRYKSNLSVALTIELVMNIIFSVISVSKGETTIALWQDDKKGVVSISLDDGLTSQIQNAFPILQEHGFKATFYIVTGDVIADPNAILTLAADGQEIGSHSCTHQKLPGLPYEQLIYELSQSQLHLQQLTGQEVDTVAYPYGAYDTNVINSARNYYIAARSGDSLVLNSSSPNSDQFYRLFAIGPHDTYGSGDANAIAGLRYWANRAVTEKKWAIELFHSIGVTGGYDMISSEAFGTHIDYLFENEPNLWVAPVGVVSEYIYERNAASITTLYQDSNSLSLQLHCGLDNRFNTPLTLLTDCPGPWIGKTIQASQNQTPLTAYIVFKDNDYYIMYNALPDAGLIELSPAMPADFNLDGHVNHKDLFILNQAWLTTSSDIGWPQFSKCDLDFNNRMDFQDLSIFADYWFMSSPVMPADFNLDGYMDCEDLFLINQAWLATSSDINWPEFSKYDLDFNNKVDFRDLAILAEYWFISS